MKNSPLYTKDIEHLKKWNHFDTYDNVDNINEFIENINIDNVKYDNLIDKRFENLIRHRNPTSNLKTSLIPRIIKHTLKIRPKINGNDETKNNNDDDDEDYYYYHYDVDNTVTFVYRKILLSKY